MPLFRRVVSGFRGGTYLQAVGPGLVAQEGAYALSSYLSRSRAALVAFVTLVSLLIPSVGPLAGTASAAMSALPSNDLLVNGSFEDGDFTGWETKDIAVPHVALAVLPAGAPLSLLTVAPTDGLFAVGHGFDGDGPDTIEFWQETAVPTGVAASLSFDWRAAWQALSDPTEERAFDVVVEPIGPTQDRTFDVVVEPIGGGDALWSKRILITDFATSPFNPDTGSTHETIDLSAFAGQTIRVKFVATIPESFTGPGSMQIDNVSLVVTDIEAPVIALDGVNPQPIEVFSSYVELGATVTDNVDAGLTAVINAKAVDTAVLGPYTVTYDATDLSSNVADQVSRTVNVVDTTPPVISLVGGTVTVGLNSEYEDLGASAVDNYDGPVSVDIGTDAVDTNAIGSYLVTFDAVDESGNAAERLFRSVNVVDTTIPVITLIGGTQFIEFPGEYIEQGATVSDNEPDLPVVIVASVDTSKLGSNIVTYDAADSSGNAAVQVIRTVIVEDTTAPVVTLNGEAAFEVAYLSKYVDEGASATDNYDADDDCCHRWCS